MKINKRYILDFIVAVIFSACCIALAFVKDANAVRILAAISSLCSVFAVVETMSQPAATGFLKVSSVIVSLVIIALTVWLFCHPAV